MGCVCRKGLHLQISHIDSARQLVHVCHGKGGKDRYVPLPQPVLEMLRQYWGTHRNPVWLFPSTHQTVQRPMDASGLQRAFQAALRESGIQKPATVHTLRHSYATHLLEAGLNLRIIQELSGACFTHHHRNLYSSNPTQRRYRHPGGQSYRGGVVELELADIFRSYGPAYRQKYADQILPSHRQAMRAIEQCRTEALGGQVYACPECGKVQYSYHSCRNRHCPKCQNDKAQEWLESQQDLLLPVPYFMLTFTLPAALCKVVRSNQKLLYNLALPNFRRGHPTSGKRSRVLLAGRSAWWVFYTPGGAIWPITHTSTTWYQPVAWLQIHKPGCLHRKDFLLPVKALSKIFRGKFRQALQKTAFFTQIPSRVWQQDWVVHCKPVGNGSTALKYLAPYVFRVAISNRRLVKLENDQVTFRYRTTDTGQLKLCTLSAEAFIHRFLQHVLPKGFVKVRYFGFFAPGCRKRLAALRQQLEQKVPGELGGVRSHTRTSRFDPCDKAVLPHLWPAAAFSTNHSSHWTLPTMSQFSFSLSIFFAGCWFSSLHSCFNSPKLKKHDPGRLLLSRFWLALVGFLIVQFIHIHMQESDFALPVCLKFQIDRLRY